MRVAIVHEWLVSVGGSDKVVQVIAEIFPEADIFTLVSDPKIVKELRLENHNITNSFIQKLPFSPKGFRKYLPLFPLAIEQFDLNNYDLIISSSHAVAKGVLTSPNQLHICYMHSPMRYVWDLYHQYLDDFKLRSGLKSFLARYFLHRIRTWDVTSSNRVDFFIANSKNVSNRIRKYYRRKSVIIYPPIDVDEFTLEKEKGDSTFCS